jgi:hypothetical protein
VRLRLRSEVANSNASPLPRLGTARFELAKIRGRHIPIPRECLIDCEGLVEREARLDPFNCALASALAAFDCAITHELLAVPGGVVVSGAFRCLGGSPFGGPLLCCGTPRRLALSTQSRRLTSFCQTCGPSSRLRR